MENIDFSLLFFTLVLLWWTGDILWKSIQALINKKGFLFFHEKIMFSFLGLLFGKKYSEEIKKRELNSERWRWKSIIGLLGGLLYLYIVFEFLFAALL